MVSTNNKYAVVFFLLCLSYVFFTNAHFSYEESLIFGGADGESYFNISSFAPEISKIKIQPIHSERFIFPYIIGFIAKIFPIEIFKIYFNKLVASSGKTKAGLKVLASSISIKA